MLLLGEASREAFAVSCRCGVNGEVSAPPPPSAADAAAEVEEAAVAGKIATILAIQTASLLELKDKCEILVALRAAEDAGTPDMNSSVASRSSVRTPGSAKDKADVQWNLGRLEAHRPPAAVHVSARVMVVSAQRLFNGCSTAALRSAMLNGCFFGADSAAERLLVVCRCGAAMRPRLSVPGWEPRSWC